MSRLRFRAPWTVFVLGCLGLLLPLSAGCSDDDPGPEPGELLDQLRALDGVSAEQFPTSTEGFTFYVLRFTQPVDHANPGGATFPQRVSLLHHDGDAPMVVLTSGYWDYYGDNPYELTDLLAANQISIEHRYFGESRPDPTDWSQLTIRQMADDQHRIITALRTIYPGAFLTTGGSKGGMTATYHRRYYPDDVEGTVAYVAPLSLGAPDLRYATFLDTVGPPACRDAVRAAATEMLQNRRVALLERAQNQASSSHMYTRIPIGPALESSIASLEFAFWQYYGINFCADVPGRTATDIEVWDFLDMISPVTDNDDDSLAAFEAYYHQAYHQLGYPDGGGAYLDAFLEYEDADYDGIFPTEIPTYDGGAAMQDIDAFVRGEADRMLFVYGEWDPWTAGAYTIGNTTNADSLLVTVREGTHGAGIPELLEGDQVKALDKIAVWSGVAPALPRLRAARTTSRGSRELREPRVPPAMIRGLRARAPPLSAPAHPALGYGCRHVSRRTGDRVHGWDRPRDRACARGRRHEGDPPRPQQGEGRRGHRAALRCAPGRGARGRVVRSLVAARGPQRRGADPRARPGAALPAQQRGHLRERAHADR